MLQIKVILEIYFLLNEKCSIMPVVLILHGTMLTETHAYCNHVLALIKFELPQNNAKVRPWF